MLEEGSRPVGFVSYSHADERDAKGQITSLVEDIRSEFSLMTGESLELFLDRNAIEWGDKWRSRIDGALQDTSFLIPIVTPRFFKSQECRNELLKFSNLARAVGAEELLLPLLFIYVEGLQEDSDDELKALIASTQFVDWTELRLMEQSSAGYRRAVHDCAKRLAEINARYAERKSPLPALLGDPEDDWGGDQPGIMDLVAVVESELPVWQDAISGLAAPTQQIGEIVRLAGERASTGKAKGKTIGHRILVAQELSNELKGPTGDLREVSEQYVASLMRIDPGVRAVIAVADDIPEGESQKGACEMFNSLLGMVASSREANESVKLLVDAIQSPAKQFKDLRQPLKVMRDSLRDILDAQAIYDEWERLIRESNIDCQKEGEIGSGPAA